MSITGDVLMYQSRTLFLFIHDSFIVSETPRANTKPYPPRIWLVPFVRIKQLAGRDLIKNGYVVGYTKSSQELVK